MKKLMYFLFGILPHIITFVLAIVVFIDWTGLSLIAGIVLMVIYMLWIILEAKFITVQDSQLGKASLDKGTFEFYFYSKWFTVYSALIYVKVSAESFIHNHALLLVGVIIYGIGVAFRLWSIKVLGNYYSHHVRIKDKHKIVNTGPYSTLRHPSYLGMFVAHIGFVVFFFNWISLSLLLVLFLPAIITRILIEEKALMKVKEYKQYSKTRKRLVPFIW